MTLKGLGIYYEHLIYCSASIERCIRANAMWALAFDVLRALNARQMGQQFVLLVYALCSLYHISYELYEKWGCTLHLYYVVATALCDLWRSICSRVAYVDFGQSIDVVQQRCGCAVNEGLRHRFVRHARQNLFLCSQADVTSPEPILGHDCKAKNQNKKS